MKAKMLVSLSQKSQHQIYLFKYYKNERRV